MQVHFTERINYLIKRNFFVHALTSVSYETCFSVIKEEVMCMDLSYFPSWFSYKDKTICILKLGYFQDNHCNFKTLFFRRAFVRDWAMKKCKTSSLKNLPGEIRISFDTGIHGESPTWISCPGWDQFSWSWSKRTIS